MTASEDWQAALRRLMDEHDAADKAARRAAVYHHGAPAPEADQGLRQQAAAAWANAEQAGYEVTVVDGAELGRDPREIIDED